MASTTGRPRRSWKKILLWAIGIAVVVFIAHPVRPVRPQQPLQPAGHQPLQVDRPPGRGDRQGVVLRLPQQRDQVVVGDQHRAVLLARAARRRRADARTSTSRSGTACRRRSASRRSCNEGEMPPFQYTLIHPGAKLTDAEKQTLVQGYAAGLAASGGVERRPAGQRRPRPTPTSRTGARTRWRSSTSAAAAATRPTRRSSYRAGERRRGAGAHRRHDPARRAGLVRASSRRSSSTSPQ